MGFTRSITDIKVHQKLGDYPNQDDGLTPEELKKTFDKPAETLQNDLNKLEEELEKESSASNLGATALDKNDKSDNNVQAKLNELKKEIQNTALGQIPDGTINQTKMEADYEATIAKKNGNLQINLNAEKVGGKTTEDILNDAEANKPYVVGKYTGDDTKKRIINLGFTPQAVILDSAGGTYLNSGALAITDSPDELDSRNDILLSITENGFIVYANTNSSDNSNKSGAVYNYIAFK